MEILRVDPDAERHQVERLKAFKEDRDQELVRTRLDELRAAAQGQRQPAPAHARRAASDRCTLGEVSGVLRDEFGEYSEA